MDFIFVCLVVLAGGFGFVWVFFCKEQGVSCVFIGFLQGSAMPKPRAELRREWEALRAVHGRL